MLKKKQQAAKPKQENINIIRTHQPYNWREKMDYKIARLENLIVILVLGWFIANTFLLYLDYLIYTNQHKPNIQETTGLIQRQLVQNNTN